MEKVNTLNLLTVKDAAQVAGLSESYLYHNALGEKITSVKLGGLLRFSRKDLGLEDENEIKDDFFISTTQLAEMLTVNRAWIYQNRDILKEAEIKVGNAKRYSAKKLLRIINRSRKSRTKMVKKTETYNWDPAKGRLISFPGCPGYKKS